MKDLAQSFLWIHHRISHGLIDLRDSTQTFWLHCRWRRGRYRSFSDQCQSLNSELRLQGWHLQHVSRLIPRFLFLCSKLVIVFHIRSLHKLNVLTGLAHKADDPNITVPGQFASQLGKADVRSQRFSKTLSGLISFHSMIGHLKLYPKNMQTIFNTCGIEARVLVSTISKIVYTMFWSHS